MDVGIALPNAVPKASGAQLTEWARRAEARGFSTLGTIDRVRYDNYEPLIALAGAAAVTERIGLATTVLLAPLRTNTVDLAKQARSVNALSGGRLTLGLGLGAREDDYEVSGVELKGRGKRLDAMLEEMTGIWEGDEVGPSAGAAPRLILGGHADAVYARMTRFGDGWISSGTGPAVAAEGAEKARAAWSDAGREGAPHIMALAYFSLGDRAEEDARENLAHYYAWLGEEVAGMIVTDAAKDAAAVQSYVTSYEEIGCDELVFCPSSADPAQVDLLAEAGLVE
jgi:alkanesulfonate monooxygenase SsuD/methylene tetrahydromethanopterin reductase-like flavin-dependent oxidoreductase (luciferase family)